MLDKSIDSALLALRLRIIRSGSDGLLHVEALLALRCVSLPPVPKAMRPDAGKRNETARLIIGALVEGPRQRAEVIVLLAAQKPHTSAQKPASAG